MSPIPLPHGASMQCSGSKAHAHEAPPTAQTPADPVLISIATKIVGRFTRGRRRHVDRRGCPIYVVTDFYTVGRPHDTGRHEPERKALMASARAKKGDTDA